jgi:hypothetical protein
LKNHVPFQLITIELIGVSTVIFHPKLTFLLLIVLPFAGFVGKGVMERAEE